MRTQYHLHIFWLIMALLLGHGFAVPHRHSKNVHAAPAGLMAVVDCGAFCAHDSRVPHFEPGATSPQECQTCTHLLQIEQIPLTNLVSYAALFFSDSPRHQDLPLSPAIICKPLNKSPPFGILSGN